MKISRAKLVMMMVIPLCLFSVNNNLLAQGGIEFITEKVDGAEVRNGIKYDGKVFRSASHLFEYQEAQMLNKSRKTSGGSKTRYVRGGSNISEQEKIRRVEEEIRRQIREREARERRANEEARNVGRINQQYLNQAVSMAKYNQTVGTEIAMQKSQESINRRQQEIAAMNYSSTHSVYKKHSMRVADYNRDEMLQALKPDVDRDALSSKYPIALFDVQAKEYPSNKNIVDVYAEAAPTKSVIYIQRQKHSDNTEIVNAAYCFKLPESEMIQVEPSEKMLPPTKETFVSLYERDSAVLRKKLNLLLVYNNIIAGFDEEIGINMVDATRDIFKVGFGIGNDLTLDAISSKLNLDDNVYGRGAKAMGNKLSDNKIEQMIDDYFVNMKKANGLNAESIDNDVYNLVSKARNVAMDAVRVGEVVGLKKITNTATTLLIHTPELGRAVGNTVASVNIYFQRQDFIAQRQDLLNEIDALHQGLKTHIRAIQSF